MSSTTAHITNVQSRSLALNKVVVLMNHSASTNIHQRGYSCHGCGSRENNIVAGSLNRGGRLNAWCIHCFTKAHFNNTTLPTSMHVPYTVLNHVSNELACHHSNCHPIVITPPDHGGCSGYCLQCTNIDTMLKLWIPEVQPWYSAALNSNKAAVVLHAPVVVGYCPPVVEANPDDDEDDDDDKTIPLPEGIMFRHIRNSTMF